MYHAYRYRFLNMRTGRFEALHFEPKRLKFLPGGEEREVKLHQLRDVVDSRGYPWDMLSAYFAGVKFISELPNEPTFINVQVVEGVPTTVELYNPRLGYRAYGDFRRAWKDATDVVVSIGSFYYQFRYLASVLPEEFYTYRTSNGKGRYYAPLRKLGIDITFFSLLTTGKGPYRLAAELGVPNQSPIALARYLYDYLDVPKLFSILSSLVNIDRHRMQFTFRDKLKTYIVYQAYLDRGYILESLPRRECEANHSQVYVRYPGLYYDMVEYDISMAYPTTVVVDRIDPYGVDVFPDLMQHLRSLRAGLSGVPSKFVKRLANSLVGMLKYEYSGFRNECAYSRVLNGVFNRWKPIAEDSVWANVDSAVLPADYDLPPIDGYEVRVEHRYRWVAVVDSRRMIGQTYEGEFVHKGMSFSYYFGDAVRLPVLWSRLDSALDHYLASDPNRIFSPLGDQLERLEEMVVSSFSEYPEEYVVTFTRSSREDVKNPYRAYVFDRLSGHGVISGVVTTDGIVPASSLDFSQVDWRYYVTAMVFSLFEHFEKSDPKVSRSLVQKIVKKLRGRFG